ncbi:MAG: methyltransferase domain-containing protein [Acidimicrobiales bacterium]
MASTSTRPDDVIDARVLAAASSVEQLAARADELVRSMEDPTALLAKPCSTLREAPDVLSCFGMLLGALAPLPGMTVLDFGAGSCWTTHFMTQLGCRVVAMDVSAAMLDLGRRRFAQQPVFGERPAPQFSLFDGHTMQLPDDSIDRIMCFDALHHVPNVAEVLKEMARVLRPGGVAGFSEPGPHHSRHPQSQHEMRRYGVPEFDLVLEDVWRWARGSGFDRLSVGVFNPAPQWVDPAQFAAFLSGGPGPGAGDAAGGAVPLSGAGAVAVALRRRLRGARLLVAELLHPAAARAGYRHLAHVRGTLGNRRMFLLHKAGTEVTDSREVSGLAADLSLDGVEIERGDGVTTVRGTCHIRNTGSNRWLASSAGQGAVLLGLRLGQGSHPAADHGRVALPGDARVEPGASLQVAFSTEVPTPGPGDEPLRLELDLVSEGIIWFAEVSGHPVEIPVPPA